MHGELVALELVALLGTVRGLLERPGGIEVVAPAGQLEPLVAKLARFPGKVIEGQIGPEGVEQFEKQLKDARKRLGELRKNAKVPGS
jgi:hypothetical protein